jgi:MFS family permease
VVGFAAGGALVAGMGVRGALLIDVVTFAGSAAVIALLVRRRPAAGKVKDAPSMWSQTAAGWRLVTADPKLLWLLAVGCIGAVVAVSTEGLAVPTAAAVGGGPITAGVLSAAVPSGYILGAFLLTRRARAEGRRLLLPLLATASVPLLLSPLLSAPWALVLLWAVAGVGSALQVIANAEFVLAIPPEMRGRAFGLAVAVLMGGQGLVLLVGGLLADVIDPREVVALVGAIGVLFVPILARCSPEPVRSAQGRHTSRRGDA